MRARLLLAFLAVLASTPRAQDTERTDPQRLRMQVEEALDAPPSNYERLLAPRQTGVRVRPFYANWIDAAALISVHNNAGAQTGTETWYDATNGLDGESARLAQVINMHVVSAIRQRYNANWIDRGLRGCNGCKGENRLATRPAIIVEIAYMDTAVPDNDALHDDAFKRIVAEAIADGIREWASAADDGRR